MSYDPATNTYLGNTALEHNYTGSSGLYVFYYQKKALDTLQKKFCFGDVVMTDSINRQSGNTIQWFRYRELGTNTTAVDAAAEGAIGTGLQMQSDTITASLSLYRDFMTVSDRLNLQAIDDVVEAAADRMSYRAAYSADTITRAEIDSIAAASRTSALSGTYFSLSDVRNAWAYLQGNDVRPMQSGTYKGEYLGIIHPFIVFDIENDPAAGGYQDMVKYTNPESLINKEDRGMAFKVSNVTFKISTNVRFSTPNYRTYIFGHGGIGGADLSGMGPSKVYDPKKERFKLFVRPNLEPSVADPTAAIGGFVSYKFFYVAKVLTDTITGGTDFNRFVYYDTPTQIA